MRGQFRDDGGGKLKAGISHAYKCTPAPPPLEKPE